MGLRWEEGVIHLDGRCVAEEAEQLLDQLRRSPMPAVDLSGCEDLHTAVIQILMAAGPVISAPPPDPILAGCLRGLARVGEPTASPDSPEPADQR